LKIPTPQRIPTMLIQKLLKLIVVSAFLHSTSYLLPQSDPCPLYTLQKKIPYRMEKKKILRQKVLTRMYT